MNTRNTAADTTGEDDQQGENKERANNPFENREPIEKDLQNAADDLQNEQQFKEAQRERD